MDERSHDRITKLLRETVVMLCKNGVCFERQLRVQGLIGVTIDDGTVFLVHMNECIDEVGCSSSDKQATNPSSIEASAGSHQSRHDRVNEQHQAEEDQWPNLPEASAVQYSSVKQERDTDRTVNDVYAESQNARDVLPSANANLHSVQETEFGYRDDYDDVICVESVSGHISEGSNRVKHEQSGIWNPLSVTFTADQQEYGLLDYSASGSHAPVLDNTLHYSESLGNETEYGDMGVTGYLNTTSSQKLLHSTLNRLPTVGSRQHKMVRHSVPRPSWHVPQIPDAQAQFAISHQPTALQHIPVNRQPHPRKRGRPRSTIQTTRMPASEPSMHGDSNKWEMVKVTKFACKLCGQTFSHQPNLFRHQITAHGREKKTRGRSTSSIS